MISLKDVLPVFLVIAALSACSDSDDSDTTAKADNTAPTFDGVATVTPSGGTNINVTWNAASDDTTTAANMQYRIYASLDMANTGMARDTVTGVTSHNLTFLEPGMMYYITVEAVDEAGNGNTNSAQLSTSTGAEVSLEFDIQPTLQAACATSNCHDAVTQLHGVNFSSAAATHATLVGVDIHHCGGTGAKRVVSGGGVAAAASSQLLNILDWASTTPCIENGATNAIQMPAGGGAELDHEFLHFLEHWIVDGAPNN